MKIMTVLGIRPDWIINSLLIKKLDKNFDHILVHSNQHYSYNMDHIFFDELEIRKPDYFLGIQGTHAEQTAKLLIETEKLIEKENPDAIISFSDCNTALCALAATKMHKKVIHLESGMRSNDWRMPEEKNRRMIDHISDILFTPIALTKNNLLKEGINENKIHISGKQIIEVMEYYMDKIDRSKILDQLELKKGEYILSTIHRAENVDDKDIFEDILKGLSEIHKDSGMVIILPVIPRTANMIKKFEIKLPEGILTVPPFGFFDFVKMEKNAFLIATDSGTVQEEACYLNVPCITLRPLTERQETINVGSNLIAGTKSIKIYEMYKIMSKKDRNWANPYDKKDATKTIINILKDKEEWIKKEKLHWDE